MRWRMCEIHVMVNVDCVIDGDEPMAPCRNEATHEHCGWVRLRVCEAHKCRCDKRLSPGRDGKEKP